MKSTVIPVISVSVAVLLCYHIGSASGIGTPRSAGTLFFILDLFCTLFVLY